MSLKTISNIALIFVATSFVACGTAYKKTPAASQPSVNLNQPLWALAKDASIRAEEAGDKQEKAKLAQDGIAFANECIMKNPEEAACYYYRAINTGTYYSAHVTGYQDGIKSMIEDCERVIKLDRNYDHGGAYRTMGKIYLELPEATLSRNSIKGDPEKAISYLQKAVQIDSEYPENHIYMSEAYEKVGKNKEALEELIIAETLVPKWKNHNDYAMWKRLNRKLSDKLKK